jgi:hypothetical protein
VYGHTDYSFHFLCDFGRFLGHAGFVVGREVSPGRRRRVSFLAAIYAEAGPAASLLEPPVLERRKAVRW